LTPMATTEQPAPAPGSSVERAAAPVCREVGARVTTITLISQLNIPSLQRVDNRRTEVIANGFPLFQGARAQLAVDTTLVPPFTAAGQLRRHQGNYAGAALAETRRAKERTHLSGACPIWTVPLGRPGGRNRRPFQHGNHNLPSFGGRSPISRCTTSAPHHGPLGLDHPVVCPSGTCSSPGLRGQFAPGRHGQHGQHRWGSAPTHLPPAASRLSISP